jgi:hypothetical protein
MLRFLQCEVYGAIYISILLQNISRGNVFDIETRLPAGLSGI